MITAKPLRRNDLRRQVRPETESALEPRRDQFQPNSTPKRTQLVCKEKYVEKEERQETRTLIVPSDKPYNIKGKTSRMIKTIVDTGHGMEAYEITRIMAEFCKAKNCFPIPESNTVSRVLYELFTNGEITRVKIDDRPYLYYKRY